jgi:hypothetical protein
MRMNSYHETNTEQPAIMLSQVQVVGESIRCGVSMQVEFQGLPTKLTTRPRVASTDPTRRDFLLEAQTT